MKLQHPEKKGTMIICENSNKITHSNIKYFRTCMEYFRTCMEYFYLRQINTFR